MSHLYYTKDRFGRDVIIAENCRVSGGPWSNFAGREVKDLKTGAIYNAEGVRNFTFIVNNTEDIELLQNESINVKKIVNQAFESEAHVTCMHAALRAATTVVAIATMRANVILMLWLRNSHGLLLELANVAPPRPY